MVQDMGNSVLIALSDSLTATANLLPNLLAAIVIFIVGVVVAAILRNVLLRVLDAANFESALSPTGIPQALKKAETSLTVSGLLGELLRWFIILIFLMVFFPLVPSPTLT